MIPRSILVHKSFIKQFEAITEKSNNFIKKKITEKLEEAAISDGTKGRMHMDIEEFQSKIYKYHIGRSGLRLICLRWNYNEKEILLPLYLSSTLRKDFNYNNINWDVPLRILGDLKNKNLSSFELWTIDNGQIKRHNLIED